MPRLTIAIAMHVSDAQCASSAVMPVRDVRTSADVPAAPDLILSRSHRLPAVRVVEAQADPDHGAAAR